MRFLGVADAGGVYANIEIRSAIKAEGNGGWGIFNHQGRVTINALEGAPFFPYTKEWSLINSNGFGTATIPMLNEAGELIHIRRNANDGGGVAASRGFLSGTRIQAIGNNGPGLAAGRDIQLRLFNTSHNKGPGVQSLNGAIHVDHTFTGSEPSTASDNLGPGILAGDAILFPNERKAAGKKWILIESAVNVERNASWGILAQQGSVRLNAMDSPFVPIDAEFANVRDNGQSQVDAWIMTEEGNLVAVPPNRITAGGVGAGQGWIVAARFRASGNFGPGLMTGINFLDPIALSPGFINIKTSIQVVSNSSWGIIASGYVSLNDTGTGFPASKLLSRVSHNGHDRWPSYVYADSFEPVKVVSDSGGGIGTGRCHLEAHLLEANHNYGPGLAASLQIELRTGGSVCGNTSGNFLSPFPPRVAEGVSLCDLDLDNISDSVESMAPNQGDGNRDGVSDSQQKHVASFPTTRPGFATLAAPQDTTLGAVWVIKSAAATPPAGTVFVSDVLSFQILTQPTNTPSSPGTPTNPSTSAVTVDLFLQGAASPTHYHRFGPTPENAAQHWHLFDFNGMTGAEMLPDRVRLQFVDGGLGDDDLLVNGAIIHRQGGPSRFIDASPPRFLSIQPHAAGGALLLLQVVPGVRYRLDHSSNLTTWQEWLRATSGANQLEAHDTNTFDIQQRFYRSIQLP